MEVTDMDISGLSASMLSGSALTGGGTGLEMVMMSKVLDVVEESGAALEKMMAQIATGLGQNIDVRA